MTFQIDNNISIWIYGFGAQGKTIFSNLINQGFMVQGFIDRKPTSGSIGVKVITPDLISDSIAIDDVIIISFQNIHEHQKVAVQLNEKGYHNLVYLKKDTSYYPQTIDYYNSLLYGGIPAVYHFPQTYFDAEEISKGLYFRDNGDTVVVDVPVQLIFTDALEVPYGSSFDEMYNYNIKAAFEYTSLFNLFIYGESDTYYLSRYIERIYKMSTDKRSREDFLADRLKLCEEMFLDFQEKGLESFRCAASFSEYDSERSRFILKDGHHRAIFLACLNQNRIPLRISKEDYLLWGKNNVDSLFSFNSLSLFTPVLNPCFYYSINALTEMNGALINSALNKFFSALDVRSYSVLDAFSTCGYYARTFWRMGAKEVVSYDPRETNIDIIEYLNDIENIDCIDVISSFPSRSFDVIVSCSDIVWNIDLLKESFIDQLFSICNKYFVISLNVLAKDIEDFFMGKGGFASYKKIDTYAYLGRQMEVYVFEKI